MTGADGTPLSANQQALLEQRLRHARSQASSAQASIPRRAHDGPAPLSPAQEQLWYFSRLAPGNPVYNEAVSIRKDGPLNTQALGAAFNELVRRHEIWRTTFREVAGEPVQVVGPPPVFELPVLDLTGLAPQERERELVRVVGAEASRPYDLEHGPLLRPFLIRLCEDHHRLYLCLHHLIFDGVSLQRVVVPELIALYEAFAGGGEPKLPEPTVQYSDYSAWSVAEVAGSAHRERIEYWRGHLDGATGLALPVDRPRRAPRRFRGAATVAPRLSSGLVAGLRRLGQETGTTLFQVLAAAFAVLLYRYASQEDVAFGTLADVRDSSQLGELVGYCLTPLVLRVGLAGEPSFVDLLDRVRGTIADGVSNLVPFQRLVRALQPQREPGANPLFQVAFVLEPPTTGIRAPWSLHQIEAEIADAVGSAKFDLLLDLDERPEGHIDQRLIYDSDLFDRDTAVAVARHWSTLLHSVVAAPDEPVSELDLLDAQERDHLLRGSDLTEATYPREACVHDLVAAQARRSPDSVAVLFGDEPLSYRELNERADALARRLALANPQRGPVAVYLERSLEMIVGLLAILKSGAAYVPLDLAHPPARSSWTLEDSGAEVLLTGRGLVESLGEHGARVVLVDEDGGPVAAELSPVAAEDSAYILYTSGSTGRPKGVCVSHRSLINLLTSVQREPGMTARDTIIALTTYAFDIAATELWLPLVTGARVVISPRDVAADGRRLADLIQSCRPTIMQATPSTWQMLIAAGWRGDPDLRVISTGEPLPPSLAEWLLERTASVWNMYGPTETTVWSTGDRLAPGERVTIGRPIANTRVYILGTDRRLVPRGVPGELAIAGDGVALGYLNRPELTSARFVPDPFVQGGRMYLTGDLARYLADGRIEHLGRLDDQIKVRGFRIEPGEIEATLTAAPDVAAAAVVARDDESVGTRLIAYLVAPTPPSPAELRERLREILPSYMVPSTFVFLDALPVSPNGKIDRGALPAPGEAHDRDTSGHEPPASPEEAHMATIWSRLLGTPVGATDDFFELGGHSLLAVRLLAEVERELGVRLDLDAFFESPRVTVRSLVAKLGASETPDARLGEHSPAHTASRPGRAGGSTRPPNLFFVQPNEVAMVALRHFAGSDYRLVGLMPGTRQRKFVPSDSVEGLARPILAEIRQAQPTGPYYLAGYSFAGLLAYEIAGRLRAESEEVAWLCVLDAWTPACLRRERSPRQMAARLRRRGPRWALTKLDEVARHEVASYLRQPNEPDEAEPPNDFDLFGATKLVMRYDCEPHDAPMDLFVTEQTGEGAGDDSLGWLGFHAGPLRVHRLSGGHQGLMRGERVNAVAQMVTAGIREAQLAFESR